VSRETEVLLPKAGDWDVEGVLPPGEHMSRYQRALGAYAEATAGLPSYKAAQVLNFHLQGSSWTDTSKTFQGQRFADYEGMYAKFFAGRRGQLLAALRDAARAHAVRKAPTLRFKVVDSEILASDGRFVARVGDSAEAQKLADRLVFAANEDSNRRGK